MSSYYLISILTFSIFYHNSLLTLNFLVFQASVPTLNLTCNGLPNLNIIITQYMVQGLVMMSHNPLISIDLRSSVCWVVR